MIRHTDFPKPDILVGGTPCQAFSVAGLREGLSDDRGQLTLEFVKLANATPESIIVWENVPGVLSSKDNAFGCFLGALAGEDCALVPSGKRWTNAGVVHGPQRTIAWRVLDAQYFGVAQRRRRVFLVACPRGGRDPAEILFESEGVRRDSPPSREAGQTSSSDPRGNSAQGNIIVDRAAFNQGQNALYKPRIEESELMSTLVSQGPHAVLPSNDYVVRTDQTGANGSGWRDNGLAYTLDGANGQAVTQTFRMTAFGQYSEDGSASTLKARDYKDETDLITGPRVRRLTPVECERLQGFPDNHTLVPYRGKPATNGPRYKALGNSMATVVMSWIGRRLSS